MICDQGSSSLGVANALVRGCESTNLVVTATPKGSKGSLGRGERANLTIQGQLRAFREDVSIRYKTEIGPDHVLMGWMVRHSAWFVNNFRVKGYRENALSFYPGQGLHWRSGATWKNLFGPKSLSQIECEMDARSLCRQACPHRRICLTDASRSSKDALCETS